MNSRRKKIIVICISSVVYLSILCYAVAQYLYNKNYEACLFSKLENAFNSNELTLKLDIDCKEIEYYHLGRDIKQEYLCNNKTVYNGDIIPAAEDLHFTARITEQDKIPDTGENSVDMVLKAPFQQTATTQVRVEEEGGTQYKDAYAIYEVSFSIEPVLDNIKVDFWEVVFYKGT